MQVSVCSYHIFNTEIIFETGAGDITMIYSLSNPNQEKLAA